MDSNADKTITLTCKSAQDQLVVDAIRKALDADGRYSLPPQGVQLIHIVDNKR